MGEAIFADVFCDFRTWLTFRTRTQDILQNFYYDVLMNIDGQAKKAYANKARITNAMSNVRRWKFRVPLPSDSPSSQAPKKSPRRLSSERPQAKPEQLFCIPSPHSGLLPIINSADHTRQHRYVYSLPQTGKSVFSTTIVKTDLVTGEATLWDSPRGHTPSEAAFVSEPGGVEEDGGVLLGVVLDGYSQTSYLVCIDAKTMLETGRVEMELAIRFGLHGGHTVQGDLQVSWAG